MKWQIVTDSSVDMVSLSQPAEEMAFSTVPFIMQLDGKDWVDEPGLSIPAFVDAMEHSGESHSACPSPAAWSERFAEADQTIAITISSQLSGCYASAELARQMTLEAHPEKKIALIDSKSTGPKMALVAHKINELVKEAPHLSFDEVVRQAEAYCKSLHTYFTLSSFGNLVKNGRMNRAVGLIASKLSIRIIGKASVEGRIQLKDKVRGDRKTLTEMVNIMREDGFSGGAVAISHCLNEPMAVELARQIKAVWQNAQVTVLPTRGLCSYYAERNGLILAF